MNTRSKFLLGGLMILGTASFLAAKSTAATAQFYLTPQELAFYDALADNESAVSLMGDAKLRVIATELLNALRTNSTVDWHKHENARARMRTLIKRILRKYGYPPNLEEAAVQTVIRQAEAILGEMTTS